MKINTNYVFIGLLIVALYLMFMPKTSGYGGPGGYKTPCTNTLQCKGQCVYPFTWPWQKRASSGKCTDG
jgi:hypothetical protein